MQRASEERLFELGKSGELDCTQNEKGTNGRNNLKENKKNYVGINIYDSLSEKAREALNPLIEHLEKRKQFSENILKNCGNKEEEQRLLSKFKKKDKIIFNISILILIKRFISFIDTKYFIFSFLYLFFSFLFFSFFFFLLFLLLYFIYSYYYN